jgi:hypothetical protein
MTTHKSGQPPPASPNGPEVGRLRPPSIIENDFGNWPIEGDLANGSTPCCIDRPESPIWRGFPPWASINRRIQKQRKVLKASAAKPKGLATPATDRKGEELEVSV